jgi:hypothetical protein
LYDRDEQPPIVTDRPDFTESSLVVPTGTTQVETGLTWEQSDDSRSFAGPEALIRRSLADKVELRVGVPLYQRVRSDGEDLEGFDDLYLGFKVQLASSEAESQAALIPAVQIPVGRRELASEATTLDLKLVWAHQLPGGLGLSGMVYYSNPQQDGSRVDTWEHTLSLGIPLKDRYAMFVEHVVDFSRTSAPFHLLHTGVTYQPSPTSQFDLHLGLELSRTSGQRFVGVGYAVRF